jgi:hypothetical protein
MLGNMGIQRVHVPVCGDVIPEKEDDMELRVIWKYELPHLETELEVPLGAQVVHIGDQHNKLCAWLMVDPLESAMETKRFKVVTTGLNFPLNEVGGLIRTVIMRGGTYVAHVYEVK